MSGNNRAIKGPCWSAAVADPLLQSVKERPLPRECSRLVHYIPWILTIACNWSRYLTANEFVVGQHGDQASHLWLRRDAAIAQPHYTLADLAKLDGQLEGNLDGLHIAGGAGWTVAERELLRWREPGEVFAAAVLAFESGEEQRVQRVLALAAASNDCARAVVSALGWLPCDRAAVTIDRFLATAPAALRRIGIAASSVHRRDPGQPLVEALESEDAALQARALRAIGELGRRELLPLATESLDAADERVRSATAWSTRCWPTSRDGRDPENNRRKLFRRKRPRLAARFVADGSCPGRIVDSPSASRS